MTACYLTTGPAGRNGISAESACGRGGLFSDEPYEAAESCNYLIKLLF